MTYSAIIICMWDVKKYVSHRGNSMRMLFVFAMTAILAILSSILFTVQPTHAAPADATWTGQSISYDGKTFTGPTDATATDGLGITPGSKYYTSIDSAPIAPAILSKAYVIYFAPGTDPPTAAAATYVTYDYTPPGVYTNPSSPSTVNITPSAASPTTSTTSCVVDGIGWIVCPVTNFLAKAMDWLFGIISSFLEVRPVQTNQQAALYRAWSVMQSFANVAFVIAFLIIIYSQLVGGMMTNYGIKKLLPRLIVAAILVNISYWICSVAVDVSNILGYSIQDIFISIRNQIVGTTGNSWNVTGWEVVTAAVLGGATALGAGAIAVHSAIVATGGGFAAAIYLLLPGLVIVLLAAVVAILVLAARQALITILVILSPLAFVAFLLPNTEKLFDKWKDTFMTLLIMFPMFSIVFGGSQLAGTAIIQNADSIVILILGMMVQIAPVVITPLLIKLSGSLLGRIAGMVNNPKKGILDRTRNWSKERADHHKARSLATPPKRNAFRASAQRKHVKHMREQQWKKAYEAESEAHGMGDKGYQDASHRMTHAGIKKDTAQAVIDKAFNDMRLSNVRVRADETNLRIAKLDVSMSEAQVEADQERYAITNPGMRAQRLTQHLATRQTEDAKATWDAETKEWESGRGGTAYAAGTPMSTLVSDSHVTAQSIAIQGMRKQQAERAGQIDLADALKTDPIRLVLAGGVMGEQGQNSVLARAKATVSQSYVEDTKNIQDTMDYALSTDIGRLETAFNTSTTLSQRIAYANTIAKNGPPGIAKLADIITTYESSAPATQDLLDFKEVLGMNGDIRKAGKSFDDWINNAKGPTVTFNTINEDIATWRNLASDKFAASNSTMQHHAIDKLTDPVAGDPVAYAKLIGNLTSSPETLRLIKPEIRDRLGI